MQNKNVFFRAGVGIILYRDNQVAFFERVDEPGHWQFPQGGMYPGESPIESMWRELQEETGLQETDIDAVHQVPFLTAYTYPDQLVDSMAHSGTAYIGQTQHWFILHVPADVRIDMSKATDNEFSDRKWMSPEETVEAIIEWKREPYKQLLEYFHQHIT